MNMPCPKRLVGDTRVGLGPLSLARLAVMVGVGAGLGAFVFRSPTARVQDLCFLGRLSIHHDTSVHTPPEPWGHVIVLAPVVGAGERHDHLRAHRGLQRGKADLAVIVPSTREAREVCGVATKAHVVGALAEGMEIFED